MERKKIVHQLDTPYSSVQWPQISQEDQDVILDLLCSLLTPLGQYRQTWIQPSKGKRRSRSKKRKRESASGEQPEPLARPPAPELSSFVDIGLANISRNLALLSGPGHHEERDEASEGKPKSKDRSLPDPYTMILVARSNQPSAFHSQFPQMVAAASEVRKLEHPVRLVGFSRACEDRLSACMGIPRVSSVALKAGAPQAAAALLEYVRARVPAVEVAWLKEALAGQYQETKINAVETKIGAKKQKKSAGRKT